VQNVVARDGETILIVLAKQTTSLASFPYISVAVVGSSHDT
jgi:hypothetical protein